MAEVLDHQIEEHSAKIRENKREFAEWKGKSQDGIIKEKTIVRTRRVNETSTSNALVHDFSPNTKIDDETCRLCKNCHKKFY